MLWRNHSLKPIISADINNYHKITGLLITAVKSDWMIVTAHVIISSASFPCIGLKKMKKRFSQNDHILEIFLNQSLNVQRTIMKKVEVHKNHTVWSLPTIDFTDCAFLLQKILLLALWSRLQMYIIILLEMYFNYVGLLPCINDGNRDIYHLRMCCGWLLLSHVVAHQMSRHCGPCWLL